MSYERPSMWMPYGPPVALFRNVISTQSPSLARSVSGWIGSSLRPIETRFGSAACSSARTSAIRFVSTYIFPVGSWSPNRLSVMSTSIADTSNVFTGAAAGQGAPGPGSAARTEPPSDAGAGTRGRAGAAGPPGGEERSAPGEQDRAAAGDTPRAGRSAVGEEQRRAE